MIPLANAGELMLKPDLVEAAREGTFHIYAVDTIHEALEILTGVPAGERNQEGRYSEETMLGKAIERAEEYWLLSVQSPVYLEDDDDKKNELEEPKAADDPA